MISISTRNMVDYPLLSSTQRPLGKRDGFPNGPCCAGSPCLYVTCPRNCMKGQVPHVDVKSLSQEDARPDTLRNLPCKGNSSWSSSPELLAQGRLCHSLTATSLWILQSVQPLSKGALCLYKLIEHMCAWHFTWHYHPIPRSSDSVERAINAGKE